MVKEHHYDAHRSYSIALMDSIFNPQFWCNRAPTIINISITTYTVIGLSTVHRQDIWITMCDINPWTISPQRVALLPSIPKCYSIMAMTDIFMIGY